MDLINIVRIFSIILTMAYIIFEIVDSSTNRYIRLSEHVFLEKEPSRENFHLAYNMFGVAMTFWFSGLDLYFGVKMVKMVILSKRSERKDKWVYIVLLALVTLMDVAAAVLLMFQLNKAMNHIAVSFVACHYQFSNILLILIGSFTKQNRRKKCKLRNPSIVTQLSDVSYHEEAPESLTS
ncbi:hypothetical protein HDU92_004587 [Lobulomyces angularis]|nr:hypothetical protein HDU92_004587 [Lobulomyces angularis]